MGNINRRRKPPVDAGRTDEIQISKEEPTCPSKDNSVTPQMCSSHELYEDNEEVFYKFVILHAETDIHEAIRMKDLLQDTFHIKPGLIFAEMPAGQHILKTLDNAVNGSAWTIILLTENFLKETWCEFQSHATLINSIQMYHKYNTVIPVRPRDNYLPRDKTPFPINLFNALEEKSPEFNWLVERTFQESVYQRHYATWKAEKESMEQREI
ncbi:PREDICTED: TIR domain-containing adapter molecule 2 [Nanorana parkeri]|uniref:TIR domain-containing adapter molecule 2 n=1 Tax=Nanorana parkeri TaxID=125878 RepID=UPI000854D0AE|nr:PREDICTED: TIR domain-containing adapter molecule 2 [Nanorana parkeri]